MRLDELEHVCQEAARDLLAREGRPLPAALVLPLPSATRVTTLPDFPDDNAERFDLIERFAGEVARPANAPCYGFVAEGTAGAGEEPVDVVVVAYGARGQPPRVSAAPIDDAGVGTFTEAEELDPAALPFLSPLQHAVDAAAPPDAAGPGPII